MTAPAGWRIQALFGPVSAAGHAVHGSLGEVLVLLHHPDDFLGCLAGARGQLTHLVGYYGEAAALIAGASASMAALSASRLV